MENNCLITKLKGSVQNNDLLKVGEIRVKMLAETSYNLFATKKAQVLSVAPGSSGSIISGGSWNANSQNRIMATANTIVSIPDKYSLTTMSINFVQDCVLVDKNINNLKYLTNLTSLSVADDEIYGDIGSLSTLNNLTILTVKPTINITGDINDLGIKENLEDVDFAHTSVGGDVSNLASNFPKLKRISFGYNCYGDVSLLNAFFIHTKDGAKMTWKGNRTASGKYVMAMENNPDFGSDLDAMLIDQAGSVPRPTSTGYLAKIIVKGTHTEGSGWQTAVTTLISNGITNVIINGTNYNSDNLPT